MHYTRNNAFAIPLTGAAGQQARVASVAVPPAEACDWRVTLGSLVPFGLESGFTAPQWGPTGPKAIVRWGHHAGAFWAAVDWTPLGNTFRVTGYDINVDILVPNALVLPAAPAPRPVAVAAIVPAGARDGARPPTFSKQLSIPGTGALEEVVQDLPPFARRMRYWLRPNSTGITPMSNSLVGVRFFDDAAKASVRYDGYEQDFQGDLYRPAGFGGPRSEQPSSDGIAIPSYAAFVGIHNTAAIGDTLVLQMEYELDLA